MEQKVNLVEATCPDCRGPLREIREDGLVEFVCLVGHRFSVESLLATHSETEERMLWAAVVALEETDRIVKAAAPFLEDGVVQHLLGLVRAKHEQAEAIRHVVENLEPLRTK